MTGDSRKTERPGRKALFMGAPKRKGEAESTSQNVITQEFTDESEKILKSVKNGEFSKRIDEGLFKGDLKSLAITLNKIIAGIETSVKNPELKNNEEIARLKKVIDQNKSDDANRISTLSEEIKKQKGLIENLKQKQDTRGFEKKEEIKKLKTEKDGAEQKQKASENLIRAKNDEIEALIKLGDELKT
ncbi:MAG: hypothetical protein KAW93_02220, partial [Methanogenium sp.]|nr:hypothetical protein [Methanogenium sp.]